MWPECSPPRLLTSNSCMVTGGAKTLIALILP